VTEQQLENAKDISKSKIQQVSKDLKSTDVCGEML
jgi:hypothetical protein